jgi:hypothetical protein
VTVFKDYFRDKNIFFIPETLHARMTKSFAYDPCCPTDYKIYQQNVKVYQIKINQNKKCLRRRPLFLGHDDDDMVEVQRSKCNNFFPSKPKVINNFLNNF